MLTGCQFQARVKPSGSYERSSAARLALRLGLLRPWSTFSLRILPPRVSFRTPVLQAIAYRTIWGSGRRLSWLGRIALPGWIRC